MHIPGHISDDFVSLPIHAATAAASIGALAYSFNRLRREMNGGQISALILAAAAAFVFAAQMLNFPIDGGTSGHFLGAAAVAALAGPWAACIVMAVVLAVQCVFFADGGLIALGSNIFNMGVIGGLLAYPLMRWFRAKLPSGRGGYLIAAAAASWVSVVLASSFCAFEIAASGTSPFGLVFPAMVGVHAVIGIGEALITVSALTAMAVFQPHVLPRWADIKATGSKASDLRLACAAVALALALAAFVSPFASAHPDGLERVAQDKGFEREADEASWPVALFPAYSVKAIESELVSTGMAGAIGTLLTFAFGLAAMRAVSRRNTTKA